MKHIFSILLCIMYASPRTIAQDMNPIYGLGLCSSNMHAIQVDIVSLKRDISGIPPSIAADKDSSLQTFLHRFEEGLNRFINGDATLWKQHVSQSEDATIMGGWGAYEKGRQQVGARYDWASARFLPSGARAEVEYLSVVVSGELAYTVSIERSKVRLVDTDKVVPLALRVTHIFRKEAGQWKLLHRHADPLLNKTVPASGLKK